MIHSDTDASHGYPLCISLSGASMMLDAAISDASVEPHQLEYGHCDYYRSVHSAIDERPLYSDIMHLIFEVWGGTLDTAEWHRSGYSPHPLVTLMQGCPS